MSPLPALLTPLLVTLGLVGGSATTTAADPAPAPPPSVQKRPLRAADALRVADQPDGSRALRTADGRTVYLRGANVNALVDYGGARATLPVAAGDGRQARALGFNVIRLAVSWSRIEPSPGRFDADYLAEVTRSAKVFSRQGLYVVLDMHQDRYGAGLGPSGDESDGAPPWASKTDGASTGGGSGGHPYYGTAASRAAAKAFFADETVAGKGLQDHYADALRQLVAVGQGLGPAFAGVELWNEPVDPWATDPYAPDAFSAQRLWPFYDRAIAAVRSVDTAVPIWFEPNTTRTWTDDDAAAARFSDDDGLVYGPHIYTDVYNGKLGWDSVGRLQASFDAAAAEARKYHAALVPTELPGASGGNWETYRRYDLLNLDRLGIGGIVWVWKQHPGANYGWGVLNADGSLRGDSMIAQDYGRPRVQASGPTVLSQTLTDGALVVRTSGAGAVDLWDGVLFGPQPEQYGTAWRLSVDGTVPAPEAVRTWRAQASLATTAAWGSGRQVRVTVGAGEHVIRLEP